VLAVAFVYLDDAPDDRLTEELEQPCRETAGCSGHIRLVVGHRLLLPMLGGDGTARP
jgi:hypothetical protein